MCTKHNYSLHIKRTCLLVTPLDQTIKS